MVGESDSEVEGEAWRLEREDTSEEEEEEIDDEVRLQSQVTGRGKPLNGTGLKRVSGGAGQVSQLLGLNWWVTVLCVGRDTWRGHPAPEGTDVLSHSQHS